jgi:hypothetical protein
MSANGPLPKTQQLSKMNLTALINQVNGINQVNVQTIDNYKRFLKYSKILDTFKQKIIQELNTINISYNKNNENSKSNFFENIQGIININLNINLLKAKIYLISPEINQNELKKKINTFESLNENNQESYKLQSGRYFKLLNYIQIDELYNRKIAEINTIIIENITYTKQEFIFNDNRSKNTDKIREYLKLSGIKIINISNFVLKLNSTNVANTNIVSLLPENTQLLIVNIDITITEKIQEIIVILIEKINESFDKKTQDLYKKLGEQIADFKTNLMDFNNLITDFKENNLQNNTKVSSIINKYKEITTIISQINGNQTSLRNIITEYTTFVSTLTSDYKPLKQQLNLQIISIKFNKSETNNKYKFQNTNNNRKNLLTNKIQSIIVKLQPQFEDYKTKMKQLQVLLMETKKLSNKLSKNITGVNQLSNLVGNTQMANLKSSMKNIEKTSLQHNNKSQELIQSLKKLQGLINTNTSIVASQLQTGPNPVNTSSIVPKVNDIVSFECKASGGCTGKIVKINLPNTGGWFGKTYETYTVIPVDSKPFPKSTKGIILNNVDIKYEDITNILK